MTSPVPTPESAGTTDLREARKAVRDCIGETIPLRRRWVSAIMARVVEPLFAERIATESRLATLAAENEALRKALDRAAETLEACAGVLAFSGDTFAEMETRTQLGIARAALTPGDRMLRASVAPSTDGGLT